MTTVVLSDLQLATINTQAARLPEPERHPFYCQVEAILKLSRLYGDRVTDAQVDKAIAMALAQPDGLARYAG